VCNLVLSDGRGLFGDACQEIPRMKNPRNRKFRFNVQFNASTYQTQSENILIAIDSPRRTMVCPHIKLSDKLDLSRDGFLNLFGMINLMIHLIKRLAYIFLYIPTLFVPNPSSVDFADRKRIDKMNIGIAIFVCILGTSLICCLLFFTYLILTQ
jgi:hypothetical protein